MTAAPSRKVMAALGQARFVGGCVRDAVLGRPVSDIDIATPVAPDRVMERLAAAGIRVIPTGLAHGTVTAVLGKAHFEITTLRRDITCFGRHAEVAFTDDWRADAARRDFTFNALSCTADGVLYDPFDGLADLAAGRVRFIGSAFERIREDVLRILRFFRFYARYGTPPADGEALEACGTLAPLLPGLSGERVRAELFRLLDHERCAEIWALMTECGVIGALLPVATGIFRLDALVRLERDHGTGTGRAVIRLAALLAGAGRAEIEAVTARLRLSRREREHLLALAAPDFALGPGDDPAFQRRALLRLGDPELFRDRMLLAAAGDESAPEMLAAAFAVLDQAADRRFPLTGTDLLACGISAGPELGRVLAELRDWWADCGFLPDRAACLSEVARRTALSS
ncbi:MAG: CCA tRNA nucleotidyltransferase [Rhodospirillaceae bacterium]